MGSSLAIVSFAGSKKGELRTGRTLYFDTPRLARLLEDVDFRGDEPEDVSFAWIERVDYEDGEPFEQAARPDDLFAPEEIIASLNWLVKLGEAGEVPKFNDPGNYTPEEFHQEWKYEIDQVRSLCVEAIAKGERIATFAV
jgi:hypothetical protein